MWYLGSALNYGDICGDWWTGSYRPDITSRAFSLVQRDKTEKDTSLAGLMGPQQVGGSISTQALLHKTPFEYSPRA